MWQNHRVPSGDDDDSMLAASPMVISPMDTFFSGQIETASVDSPHSMTGPDGFGFVWTSSGSLDSCTTSYFY